MSVRMGIERRGQDNQFEVTRIFQNNLQELGPDVDAVIAVGKFSEPQVKDLASVTDNLVFVDDDQFDAGFDSVITDFRLATEKLSIILATQLSSYWLYSRSRNDNRPSVSGS